MAFREVAVFEVQEVLRLWVGGEGIRTTERLAGVDRKTVRRYVEAAERLGLPRDGGEEQLSDSDRFGGGGGSPSSLRRPRGVLAAAFRLSRSDQGVAQFGPHRGQGGRALGPEGSGGAATDPAPLRQRSLRSTAGARRRRCRDLLPIRCGCLEFGLGISPAVSIGGHGLLMSGSSSPARGGTSVVSWRL